MSGSITIPEINLTETRKPPVGFHFAVIFFTGENVSDPLDMRFRKVSGLSSEIETVTYKEGGENLYTHHLPTRVSYNNLVLERGMVVDSPLNIEFNTAMSSLKFYPSNVLVALLDNDGLPLSGWLFWKAYPVKWSVSDLDADVNAVVIETMELAYTRFQVMRI